MSIKLNTPSLDEQAFHTGNFVGVEADKNPVNPFCYAYGHWHFAKSLNKKDLTLLKKIVDEAIEVKLDFMSDDAEIFKIERFWAGEIKPNFQIILLKNLQKAMYADVWERPSDLFMESALYDVLEDSFTFAFDDGSEKERKNWIKVLSDVLDESEIENLSSHDWEMIAERIFWDFDFQFFEPDKKAIKEYHNYLRTK